MPDDEKRICDNCGKETTEDDGDNLGALLWWCQECIDAPEK